MRRMAAYCIDMVWQREDDHLNIVATSSVTIKCIFCHCLVTCHHARPWHIFRASFSSFEARLVLNRPFTKPRDHNQSPTTVSMMTDSYVVLTTLIGASAANEIQSMIASAVALPEDETPDDTARPNGVKRRLSDLAGEEKEEQESKRQRVSPGKSSPTTARDGDDSSKRPTTDAEVQEKTTDPREARRKSTITDDKQRSKRLFGALLGNLNQPRDRTAKRREEIESRKKAELQRQDDKRIEEKQRRQEKLAEQRKKAQVKVEEENVCDTADMLALLDGKLMVWIQMHIRHSNMLNSANYLQTLAEPKIVSFH